MRYQQLRLILFYFIVMHKLSRIKLFQTLFRLNRYQLGRQHFHLLKLPTLHAEFEIRLCTFNSTFQRAENIKKTQQIQIGT